MNEDEAGRFLEAAREDRYFPLWVVLLTGGLRPGEALGLKWEDVNFEESRIHVRHSLTRVGLDREKYPDGWMLKDTKTGRGRTVPLPDLAIRALREWKKKQAGERLLVGSEWQDHGFVFTTPNGSPPNQSNLNTRNFNQVMARAGLKGSGDPNPRSPGMDPGRSAPSSPLSACMTSVDLPQKRYHLEC